MKMLSIDEGGFHSAVNLRMRAEKPVGSVVRVINRKRLSVLIRLQNK